MDCQEARRQAASNPEAASHVATCKMCNSVIAHPDVEELLRASARALAAPAHMPDPWPRLKSTLAAERGPHAWLQALPRGWVAACGLVVSLATIFYVDAQSRGPHWDRWPLWHQLVVIVGGSALLGGGLAIGLRSVFRSPSKALLWTLGALAVATGVVLALTPATLGAAPDTTPFVWDSAFTAGVIGCMRYGFLACVPLLAWLAISHRWQPARPSRRFASAASAALLGMLALEIHCPALGGMHRLVAHASLGVILGGAALLVGIFR